MARYWWQCTSCGDRPAWLTVCHSRSIAAFIWDELAPSGWDQRLLRRKCKCKRHSLRITYRFQRGDPERISINHIVGLAPENLRRAGFARAVTAQLNELKAGRDARFDVQIDGEAAGLVTEVTFASVPGALRAMV